MQTLVAACHRIRQCLVTPRPLPRGLSWASSPPLRLYSGTWGNGFGMCCTGNKSAAGRWEAGDIAAVFAADAEVTAFVLTIAGLADICWLVALLRTFIGIKIGRKTTYSASLGCCLDCVTDASAYRVLRVVQRTLAIEGTARCT